MKFGLLWHSFSSGNLGVGALSISNMLLIDEAARRKGITPEFLIIGSSGPCDYPPSMERFNYEFIEFNEKSLLKSPHKLIKAIGSCDAIFDIGEGDSFSDIYGSKRLIKLLLSKGMALMGRVPLILSPQTIGPFSPTPTPGRPLGDEEEHHGVRPRPPVLRGARAARRAEPRRSHRRRLRPALRARQRDARARAAGGGHQRLGAAAPWRLRSTANQFGLRADYKALTDQLIEALLGQGHEVHLVPHVIPLGFPAEDDFAISQTLQQRHPALKLAPRFKGPVEAKSYISGLDFFIGARMHATIGAFSAGVPVVPLAYSRKFAGLYESLDYHRVVDLKTETTESALQKVLAHLEQRDRLKAEVEASSEIIRRKLAAYSYALEGLMTSLRQGQPAYQE